MKKKKKGSSLVMSLMVFSILSILGASLLSVTSNDYYRRVGETKKLQNLYGSESGLDVSYNIIAKTFEAAVVYGNKAVEYNVESVPGKLSIVQQEMMNIKEGKNVLYPVESNLKESMIVNKDLSVNQEGLKEVQKTIFKEAFNLFIDAYLKRCIESGKYPLVSEYFEISNISPLTFKEIDYETKNTTKIEAKVTPNNNSNNITSYGTGSETITLTVNKSENNLFNVEIISEFYTGTEESKENSRKISAKYDIEVPEYQFYIKYEKVTIKDHPIFQKVIAIDGNMNVQGNTAINGDIYVKGITKNESEISDLIFDKYYGGIIVAREENDTSTNKITLNVDGEIVTTGTLLLRDKAEATIDGNVFASNIHIGRLSNISEDITSIKYTNICSDDKKGTYLSNDLSIYGNDTVGSIGDGIRVDIDNFYGINDVNTNNSSINKALKSSSIILNSNNKATVNINKRAYIWGTAYINTDNPEKYQTGESVAIKGNYIAYSDTLGKDNVELGYYSPLQLISKVNGEDATIFDKANHIAEYAANDELKTNLNLVGIKLPSIKGNSKEENTPLGTFTVGAYITMDGKSSKGDIKSDITADEIANMELSTIKTMREKFADKVLYMDMAKYVDNANKINAFYQGQAINTVSTEIKTEAILEKNEITTELNNVIFSKDKTIVILDDISKKNNYDKDYIFIEAIDDVKNNKKVVSGLIITGGDVIVDGDITFIGGIIAKGSLTCKKDSNIIFNSDIGLVQKLVAQYYEDLEAVIRNYGEKLPTLQVDTNVSEGNDGDSSFNIKGYIKKGIWKIEK